MTRKEAIATLSRMGDPFGEDEITEAMLGDLWVPRTDAEWAKYFSTDDIYTPDHADHSQPEMSCGSAGY